MPFISKILEYKSLSIVGLDKNTGKTVTLNYILKELSKRDVIVGITSIGIDGEGLDQVTKTAKPEIIIYKDMYFTTSEKHYKSKQLVAEIYDVSSYSTALGRLVTGLAKNTGKVLLSGPANTSNLVKVIENNAKLGCNLTIIDGALSRMSLASPSITQATILATGAAYSINLNKLVRRTKFICNLIKIERVDIATFNILKKIGTGIWIINKNESLEKLNINSVFALFLSQNKSYLDKLKNANVLFISGVLNDKLLEFLRIQEYIKELIIVVKDFTKIFVSEKVYKSFNNVGGKLRVLYNTKLIAVTFNPTSPEGYTMDSKKTRKVLSENINLPVYDVKDIDV